MEEFVLMPQPYGVVFAAFVVAFLLSHETDKLVEVERKLHLRRLRILIVVIAVLLPLLFANWNDDVLVTARQVLGYLLILTVGYSIGMLTFSDDEKKP